MKRLLISMTILALLIVPQFALGADVDDLKAANEKVIKGWNNFDAESIASTIYPGSVMFYADAPFPEVGAMGPMKDTQAQLTQGLRMVFGNLEFISITPYNLQYRVVENTGVIWGYYTINSKPKGQPSTISYVRMTATWIKSEGKWFCLTTHMSAIPLGN